MKKFSIAIIYDSLPDFSSTIAGSLQSALRFAGYLTQRGHKVIFLTSKTNKAIIDTDYNGLKAYRFFSFKLPVADGKAHLAFSRVGSIKKVLIDEKIDILHFMVPSPLALLSVKAAKELNLKIVAHSHMQPENVLYNLTSRLNNKRLNNLFYRYIIWAYKGADIVVCPTRFSELMLKKYCSSLPTAVISNGIDQGKFHKVNTHSIRKKYGLSGNKKYLLSVGRLHPEKRVHIIIQSMKLIMRKVPDAVLLVVGEGYLKDSLVNLTHELKLDHYVKFLGRISDSELVEAYSISKIFILASLIELEGMALLEAMACGNPVIVSDSDDSAAKFIVQGNGYLFKHENPGDLAKKVISLSNNDLQRKKMANQSLALIKAYEIKNSISKLEEVYLGLFKVKK